MTTLSTLLADLRPHGVTLHLDPKAGKVRATAPEPLPDALRQAIAASKPALLRLAPDGPLVASPSELATLARRLPSVDWPLLRHCCQTEQWQRAYGAAGLARLNDPEYEQAVAYIEDAKATALAALTAAWGNVAPEPAPVAPPALRPSRPSGTDLMTAIDAAIKDKPPGYSPLDSLRAKQEV